MQRSNSWYTAGPQLGRTVTAPGILETVGSREKYTDPEEGKTVSFYLGDEKSSNELEVSYWFIFFLL